MQHDDNSLSHARATWISTSGTYRQLAPTAPALCDAVLLVPTEHVHLTRVHLPIKQRAAKLSALAFALEPELAEPIEQLHTILGPALDGDTYLAGAISRSIMTEWCEAADAAGLSKRIMVPDVLLLPIPQEDCLTIAELPDGRILVRKSDATGFAVTHDNLALIWQLEGCPEPVLITGQVTLGGQRIMATSPAFADPPTLSEMIDIRQGDFSRRVGDTEKKLKLSVAVVGVALLAYAAVGLIDVLALQNTARVREAALIASFQERFPDAPAGIELLETISALQQRRETSQSSPFLQTLALTSARLQDGPPIGVQNLNFDINEGAMRMSIEAASISALQDITSALSDAGIPTDLSAARSIPGGAEGQLTIILAETDN